MNSAVGAASQLFDPLSPFSSSSFSLCPTWSFLFTGLNTHPWPARLNEPCSPHVPQKCHCGGVTQAFLPRRQCDFYIRCHGDVARREEKWGRVLTSGFSRLPGQTVHFRGGSRKEAALCLFVCMLTIAALEKGETGTLWRYPSNGHTLGNLWHSKWHEGQCRVTKNQNSNKKIRHHH